jgi:hypothetical protein
MTNNGTLDLATRPAPQSVNARMGSHWMSFSVARRKGSVHSTSQATNVNRSRKVQSLVKLNKRARQYDRFIGAAPYLNGEEPQTAPTAAIEAPTLAQLEAAAGGAGGAVVSTNGARKKK